jgi:hypothetical protein
VCAKRFIIFSQLLSQKLFPILNFKKIHPQGHAPQIGKCGVNMELNLPNLQKHRKILQFKSITSTFLHSTQICWIYIPSIHHAYQVYHHFIIATCFGPLGPSSGDLSIHS